MDDFELEDAARSAFESAMAFGVDLNAFMRLAKTIRAAEREACAKLVEAGKIVPTLHEGTVAVDWDSSEEAAAAIRAL